MSHPSELKWARHLAGELGPRERWSLRRHLAACEACQRLECQLAAERRLFNAAPERSGEVEQLAGSLARAPGVEAQRWRWQWVPLALAGAVAALLLLRLPPGESFSAKGANVFELHVRRGNGDAPLGGQCRAGDAIRAHYRSDRRYLLVVETGSTGEPQPVFPFGGGRSQEIAAGSQLTPGSWVLDAAPGRECFEAFFSDRPVSVAEARAALGEPASPLPDVATSAACCDKVSP